MQTGMGTSINNYKKEMIIPKTNQGFLWNISNPKQNETSIHVLSLAGHKWTNPLQTNPKVNEVFQNSKILYLEHPPLKETEEEKMLLKIFHSPETEIKQELLIEIKDLASDYLSKAELLPITKKIHNELLKKRTTHQDVFLLLYLILLNHRETHCDLHEESFTKVASKCIQEVRFLQSEQAHLEFLNNYLELAAKFFDNKLTLLMFRSILKNNHLLNYDLRKSLFHYHAWSLGDTRGVNEKDYSSPYIDTMREILKQEYPNINDQIQAMKEYNQLHALMDDYAKKHRNKILERIPDVLLEGKQSIVVLNLGESSKTDDVISHLDNLGLKIQQVVIPMKPVGFFWKIKDKAGKKAYLLGTQHYAPQELIILNTKIHQCFNKSHAVGVEIDITRQDVVEILKNFSKKGVDVKEQQYFESQSLITQQLIIGILKLFACKKGLKVEVHENDSSLFDQYLIYQRFISQCLMAEIGYQSGIERDLIPKAKELGKPVKDLEDLNSHMESIKYELNNESRLNALIEIILDSDFESKIEKMYEQKKEKIKNHFDELSRISIYGYTEKLMDMLQAMSDSHKRIFNKRNLKIASKIDDFIQESDQRFFFMVGAMHFPGDHGLIKLLEGLGYKVKQVIIEEPL